VAGLIPLAKSDEGVNVPEGADEKSVFGLAKVILLHVPVDKVATPQVTADRAYRADITRVISRKEPEWLHQEKTGVKRVAVHRGGECSHVGIPRPFGDHLMDLVGKVAPVRRSIAE